MISLRAHSVINYLLVAFILLTPFIFSFQSYNDLALYILAMVILLVTVISKIPYSLASVLPILTHRVLEWAVGATFLFFGFMQVPDKKDRAEVYFFIMAAVILLVSFTTNWPSISRRAGKNDAMQRPSEVQYHH